MTITTTQFQTVKLAVETILAGEELASVFLPQLGSDTLEQTIRNFNDFNESFDNNRLDTTMVDIEMALDTLEKVANNIIDYYDMNVFSELSDYYDFDEVLDIIENENAILHGDVFEMSEIAENYLDGTGDLEHHASEYLDENALLRDLHMGGDISNYYYERAKEDALEDGKTEEEAQDLASDYEITDEDEREYLDLVIECAGKEFLSRYFDYEKFGNDMEIDGSFYTCDSGMIEVIA